MLPIRHTFTPAGGCGEIGSVDVLFPTCRLIIHPFLTYSATKYTIERAKEEPLQSRSCGTSCSV